MKRIVPHCNTHNFSTSQRLNFGLLMLVMLVLFACATTDETTRLRRDMAAVDNEFSDFKATTGKKLADMSRDSENLRKQLATLSSRFDERDDKIKALSGKLDDLEYQLRTYWNEVKTEINAMKKPGAPSPDAPPSTTGQDYERAYKEAFDAFQKKEYEDAVNKFSAFIKSHEGSPLAPNAYYWLGESCMGLKDYEKAIRNFQELIDKYPKHDKTPRALLSQADAFTFINDKKSAATVLKKIIDLFPKKEEAIIADRRLRNLNL